MFLGYNTNGLAHHDLFQAVELLADLGYRGVAITLDHHALNPYADDLPHQLKRMRRLLERLGMRSAIETGARYLLDPRTKHEPTLSSPEADARQKRIDFLRRAIDIAAQLGSDCVSLWSGRRREIVNIEQAQAWLVEGLRQVLDHAARANVPIAFEPEPDMLIDTMDAYAALDAQLADSGLRLALDIGHLHCQGEVPLPGFIRHWAHRLIHVHIEDMRAGVHEHLMFGEGEIDFPPVVAALAEVGYDGGLYVELSRHSHAGPQAAAQAAAFLQPLLATHGSPPR